MFAPACFLLRKAVSAIVKASCRSRSLCRLADPLCPSSGAFEYLANIIPVVPRTRRGGSCLRDVYKTFLIYRTCTRRAPAKPVRACALRNWCPVSHFTFEAPRHTSHLTVFTLHAALFTLHTPHCTLRTPHSSHFTLHSSHSTLHTSHCALHSPHFTLHSSHSKRHTSQSTLHTSHSTLHTALFLPHTSHCTLHLI